MISVDRLTDVPSLGLSYLAGVAGGARLVTWAHACDLPDPWEWFESGDLVMTTGGGLPTDEPDQVEWIVKLIDSRVSALVVAPEPNAPALSAGMLAAAEERNFPVLAADFDLHFVDLARTVIESAVESERYRVSTITRLYDVYWQSLHARGDFVDRVSALEGATGFALEVRDSAAEESIVRGREAARSKSGGEPGGSVQIPIPGVGDNVLIARAARSDPASDRALLQHVGGLIALELEHDAVWRDHLRASGEDLLLGLLDGTIPISAMWPELRHRGMGGAVVAVCWTAPGAQSLSHQTIHRDARLQHCAPLLTHRGSVLIGLAPNDPDLLVALARKLGDGCVVGVSAPLKVNGDVSESIRQAQLASARALSDTAPVLTYDELDGSTGVLPRSVEDTRRLVTKVLGPLLKYDRENEGELVESARLFLRNDGNWQRSADALGIHRQTLVYRLRKVEQLTGLKATTTQGVAMLWLAFEAVDQAHLPLIDLVQE
ncbi:PucR family transcriptional regulator [Nocardia sp. 348MFTsu5.1]|uniref:PucR family transcriptional regulator n=1 Tax=Nocardia sp. 348MFTsu5.1 TaxID=1172185 RepID=UPI000376DB08|nr:PucR family transcriptional regulator [Nocardia sp. 348MFTsu5.1]